MPWLYAAAVTLRWQMVAMEIQALVRYSDFLMKNSPILKFQASVLPFKYHRLSVLLWLLLSYLAHGAFSLQLVPWSQVQALAPKVETCLFLLCAMKRQRKPSTQRKE